MNRLMNIYKRLLLTLKYINTLSTINSMKPKNFPQFTHFACIPFIRQQYRKTLDVIQTRIEQIFKQQKLSHTLNRSNTNLMHITLSMLTLNLQQNRKKSKLVFERLQKPICQILKGAKFTLSDIKYFTKYNKYDKRTNVSLFYFDFIRDQNLIKLDKVSDMIIREMIKDQIINPNELKSMKIKYDHNTGMYINQQYHMTLFRIQGLNEDQQFKELFNRIQQIKDQHKQQLTFIFQFDSIDISTRFHFDKTFFYEPLARISTNQHPIQ